MTENELAKIIVDTAFQLHQKLGPGLLESAYEAIMFHELATQGLHLERQVAIPLVWNGTVIDESYRADFIVERKVLIELKSVEKLIPVHKKQVITYLKVSGIKLGLLINFGAALIRDGIERIVNQLPEND
jgi:GxxExxY protein